VILVTGADWSVALGGVSALVHCAARVHVMQETTADPLEEFRRVNGEATQPGCPFTADDAPAPLTTGEPLLQGESQPWRFL